jgi:hypothetical protein
MRGADPRDGRASDCLELAIAAVESTDQQQVVAEANLLRKMLRDEQWGGLAQVWCETTDPVDAVQFGDVAMVYNPPGMKVRYGLVTALDQELSIFALEARGVMVMPSKRIGTLQFRRYRGQATT